MTRVKKSKHWKGAALLLAVAAGACGPERVETPTPMPADTVDRGPVGDPVDVEPPRRPMPADTAARERPRPDPMPEPAPDPEPDTAAAVDDPAADPATTDAMAPPSHAPVPVLPGAVLPSQRIVAFYGNPASTRMGILGELAPDEMLGRLDQEVAAWRRADPSRAVRPALHMIAVMAAGDPGPDSLFRLRMPDWRIRQVTEWAARRNALVFLDIQPGRSTVAAELPRLREWLSQPDVHLALDPEWTMGPDDVPGTRIGSMDATDINRAIAFLADIVEEHDLPPKVLVIHRFTQSMVRNADRIRRDPRVQVVMHMDGWGPPSQKRHAYNDIVAPEASQFTGFKLFFRNDLKGGSRLMTPAEILELDPVPVYIQYQ